MATDLISLINWLPQTKLHAPQLRTDTIIRTKLLNSVRQAITDHPLTLVTAPAGYGKTTLLATLPIAFPRLAVAWLALDKHDNDPIHLVMGLAGALRSLAEDCCGSVLGLFHAGDRPDSLDVGMQAQRFMGLMINELMEHVSHPIILILDDYHALTEPAAHASMDYLLRRLPAQMHLVINSRRTPPLALPRLRARGRLAEFRPTELAFSLDETAAFLNGQLGLELSGADLKRLHRYTEGWPVGLRLLGSSLETISRPAERRAEVARLVRADLGRSHIFDYLAQEVLSHQPPAVREFLLKTSILPELTPTLCQAVTGWSDAPTILADLYGRNLFLVNVSEERRHIIGKQRHRPQNGYQAQRSVLAVDQSAAYRYHDLFADFLRHRLALTRPDEIPELHRRAAEATADPERKIDHYLAAQMWEPAARTIARVGESLLHQGMEPTLAGWIEALPAVTRQNQPKLLYLLGVCAWHRKSFDTAGDLLEQALAGYKTAGDQVGQGQTLVNLATCALLQADFPRLEQLIEHGLTYPITPADQIQLLMSRTWLRFHQNAWAQAEADFAEAISIAGQADERPAWRMLTLYLSPALAVLENGLAHLESICRYAQGVSPRPDNFWQIAIDWQVAFSHFQRGRFDRTGQLALDLLARSEKFGDTYLPYQTDMLFMLAVAQAAYGHYTQAEAYFDQLFSRTGLTPMAQPVLIGYLYAQGRAYCQQGRLEDARQVLAQMSDLNRRHHFPAGAVLLPLLEGLLALAEHRDEAAEASLQEAARLEPELRVSTLFGSSRLLLAHLYLSRQRSDEALAALAPVLAECEQQDTAGLILQEGPVMIPLLRLAARQGVRAPCAARMLALFGVTGVRRAIPIPDTSETLTSREVEVLELIAAGATNREIAEQLDISRITVKSHVTRLLRKLDVSSRTQAAARARELGVVQDTNQS